MLSIDKTCSVVIDGLDVHTLRDVCELARTRLAETKVLTEAQTIAVAQFVERVFHET